MSLSTTHLVAMQIIVDNFEDNIKNGDKMAESRDVIIIRELLENNSDWIKSAIKENEDGIRVIKIIVDGGNDPTKGLVVRLDRLEQEAKRRETWSKAAVTSSISAFIGMIAMLIKHFVIK